LYYIGCGGPEYNPELPVFERLSAATVLTPNLELPLYLCDEAHFAAYSTPADSLPFSIRNWKMMRQ
jgi:hypothetical protein